MIEQFIGNGFINEKPKNILKRKICNEKKLLLPCDSNSCPIEYGVWRVIIEQRRAAYWLHVVRRIYVVLIAHT